MKIPIRICENAMVHQPPPTSLPNMWSPYGPPAVVRPLRPQHRWRAHVAHAAWPIGWVSRRTDRVLTASAWRVGPGRAAEGLAEGAELLGSRPATVWQRGGDIGGAVGGAATGCHAVCEVKTPSRVQPAISYVCSKAVQSVVPWEGRSVTAGCT